MRKSFGLIAIFLVFSLFLISCSSEPNDNVEDVDNELSEGIEEENAEPSKDKEEDSEEDKAQEDEDGDTGNDDSALSDIFNKTEELKEYTYETEMISVEGISSQSKTWVSENKMKIVTKQSFENEELESMIGEDETVMIMDSEENVTYFYSKKDKTGTKIDHNILEDEQGESFQPGTQDYVEIMKEISDDGNVKVEKGTLNGEKVDIITGEVLGDTSKTWISSKTGFPLKNEIYSDGEVQLTIIYKDFKEEAINPSEFTVPDDIKFTDMTQ